MFDFLKRKKNQEEQKPDTNQKEITIEPTIPAQAPAGFFNKLKTGLAKTRANFTNTLANLVLGKKALTKEVIGEIEMALLTADVGVETTDQLIQSITTKLARKELNDTEAAYKVLQQDMGNLLTPFAKPLEIPGDSKPFVILVVGVNGSGKTTSIGKLAHLYKESGKSVMLAAGDTFRAAAIEQLQVWGERNAIPVVAQAAGADTAAVIYDAFAAAKARHIDVLLADTAGRLHTQSNLMAELKKIKKVIKKIDPDAPHEVLIILDATLGQNAMNQVKQFNEAIGVTGIALTKLDGTAKGGILFALAQQMKIPIRFIGVGEGIEDLRPFNAEDFVNALFNP